MSVQELTRRVGQSASRVSKHLIVLRETGLVEQTYGRCKRLSPLVRVSRET